MKVCKVSKILHCSTGGKCETCEQLHNSLSEKLVNEFEISFPVFCLKDIGILLLAFQVNVILSMTRTLRGHLVIGF